MILCYGDGQAPLVDAYSLGRLLRYMLTGVTPDKSIMDALDEQSGMIDACFCLGLGKSSSKSKRRIVEPRCASPRSAEIMRRDQPRSCARPEMRLSCAELKVTAKVPRTRFGRYLSADARDLMARLTEADPGKRLGVSDARKHAWMGPCKAE